MSIRTLLALLILIPACGDDDAASPLRDLSAGPNDFAVSSADAAVPDMTVVGPSGQIAQVRAMADSAMTPDGGTIALPVADVFVTYVKPLIGTDSAGFFVQAEQTGPALFIAVDAATLSPAPQPGDLVSFTVTAVIKDAGGVREARSVSDWVVSSSGNDISGLVQDLSAAADLVSMVDNYESELAHVEGTVTGDIGTSGTGFVQANMTTAGVATGTLPRLRLPTTVRDALDITKGCSVKLTAPLWRFNKSAQPSAWATADITASGCPAPSLLSATATSATTAVLTFDRFIDAATVSAGQFTFTSAANMITASAAAVTGNVVTVTTTAQTAGQSYTVTVGTAVKDKTGVAVNPAANSAVFKGYAAPATLIITEFNPNIAGADQIEFKALTGGSINGFKVYYDFTAANRTHLSDLPDIVVAQNEFILLHLSPPPSPAPLATETTDKNSCTDPTCVNGAWDVAATTNTGLPFTRRLISLTAPDGTTVDAISYTHKSGTVANAGTELQAAITAGLWTTACAASPCNATTDFDAASIDVTGLPATVTGNSAQRKSDVLHSGLSDWQVTTQTWGQ